MTPELAATRAATDEGSGSTPNVGRGRRGCAIGAPLNDTSRATGRGHVKVGLEVAGPRQRRVGPEDPREAEVGRGRVAEAREGSAEGSEDGSEADKDGESEEKFASKASPTWTRQGARKAAEDGTASPPEEDEGAIEEGVLLGVAKADVGGFAHGGEALAMARNEPQCRMRRWRTLLQNCGAMHDDESRECALESFAGVG